MKQLLAVFYFLLMGVSVASATGQLTITPEYVQIVRAEFGLFNPSASGDLVFMPSKTVPLVVQQAYGWRILLKTNKAKIKWREEFTLPVAPVTWGDAENLVSKNRRVSVMEREVPPVDGVIFNAWTVAAGDPKGHHLMRVLIDNQYEQVFEFDVQERPTSK
jgi:hypothetical protein